MPRNVGLTAVQGGICLTHFFITVSGTLEEQDGYVLVNPGTGTVDLTPPASPRPGQIYFISRTVTTGTIRILYVAGQNLNGGTSNITLNTSVNGCYKMMWIPSYGWKITS